MYHDCFKFCPFTLTVLKCPKGIHIDYCVLLETGSSHAIQLTLAFARSIVAWRLGGCCA